MIAEIAQPLQPIIDVKKIQVDLACLHSESITQWNQKPRQFLEPSPLVISVGGNCREPVSRLGTLVSVDKLHRRATPRPFQLNLRGSRNTYQ